MEADPAASATGLTRIYQIHVLRSELPKDDGLVCGAFGRCLSLREASDRFGNQEVLGITSEILLELSGGKGSRIDRNW